MQHGFYLDNNIEHNVVDIPIGLTAEYGEFPNMAEKLAMLPEDAVT